MVTKSRKGSLRIGLVLQFMGKKVEADPLPDVTTLLVAWRNGDEAALERLLPLVYDELRRTARAHLRRERPDHTLQPTALVNEAFLRLVDVRKVAYRDRAHFCAMAARLMRRVLVDAARARNYQKRGGGAARTLFDEGVIAAPDNHHVMALDDALEALGTSYPRAFRVVELRFFGGLSVQETAAALECSADTITRDWKFAKAFLLRELDGNPGRGH